MFIFLRFQDESEESNASISIKPSPEQGILISPGFKWVPNTDITISMGTWNKAL